MCSRRSNSAHDEKSDSVFYIKIYFSNRIFSMVTRDDQRGLLNVAEGFHRTKWLLFFKTHSFYLPSNRSQIK